MVVRVRWLGLLALTTSAALAAVTACGSTSKGDGAAGGSGGGGSGGSSGGGANGGSSAGTSAPGADGGAVDNAGAASSVGGGEAGAGGAADQDPLTCANLQNRALYVGCDFWPTFTANPVWDTFSPGVAIVNEGTLPAHVTVTGPAGFTKTLQVEAGQSSSLELPWVPDLKGPQFSTTNTSGARPTESRRVNGGAYHVVSDAPIAVFQFNPLEQQHEGDGCPPSISACRSASNDGTQLIPAQMLTGNYRVFTYSGKNDGEDWGGVPGGFAVTATADNTEVTIQAGPRCGTEILNTTDLGPCTAVGPSLIARNAFDVFKLTLNAGDVVQLMGAKAANPTLKNADLSGTLVHATQPVQVISFASIVNIPDISVASSNHLEEVLPPAESLDKRYVVVPPSSPLGEPHGHVVRLYGHVDGTQLTYPGGKPLGAPDVLNAGDVAQIPPLPGGVPAPDCLTAAGKCVLDEPFVVEANQPFAVASFMPGGVLQMPGTDALNSQGDPAQSFVIPPRQFRSQLSFFVPEGYVSAFVDLLLPKSAQVTLDGVVPASAPAPIATSDWSVLRLPVMPGLHRVDTGDVNVQVGAQVSAFGYATAVYYAAGPNQLRLSEPPVIVAR